MAALDQPPVLILCIQNGFDISMDFVDILEHMIRRSQTEFRSLVYGTERAAIPRTVACDAHKQAVGFTGGPDAVPLIMQCEC